MSNYQALYRVWRPQTFGDVVGQEHITQTLQNAIQENAYSHAYLFSGPRGTGKTSLAKIIAKAVNCEHGPSTEPCNQCPSCKGITKGSIIDVMEIDAASNNSVEQIRDIRDKVKYAPTEVRKKVYIIDEVHMLSTGAFNALLKTLEEPPSHVMFILATTETHKIPATIVSRCQRFDFKRISKQTLVDRMAFICQEQGISIQSEALNLIAQVAEGGMRDSLSLLDQAISYTDGNVTLEDCIAVTGAVSQESLTQLADTIMNKQMDESVRLLDTLTSEGKEPLRLVEDLIYYYRDILLYQTSPELDGLFERVNVNEEFKEKVKGYSRQTLFSIIEKLSTAQSEMKWSNHPRVFLEVAFVQIIQDDPVTVSHVSVESAPTGTNHEQSKELEEMKVLVQGLVEQVNGLKVDLQKERQERITLTEKLAKNRAPVVPSNKTNPASDVQKEQGKEIVVDVEVDKTPANTPSFEFTIPDPLTPRGMLYHATKPMLNNLQEQWQEVSKDIKTKGLPTYAWLKGGTLTVCSDKCFLLVFNSKQHKDNVEASKDTIEQVVSSYTQIPMNMLTLMVDEWEEVKKKFLVEKEKMKVLKLTDPFYAEAVKLVGKDLVEVKK